MPARPWRTRVQDVVDAIAAIERYTAGMTVDDFAQDRRTVDAVLYQFGIVGEASVHVPQDVQERLPEIGWRRLRETRNVVTRVYFGVDLHRIWGLAQRRLPEERRRLTTLLADEAEGLP